MADDVVIVDANGNEHHFPSGFDPKRAASIVSTQIAADVKSRPLLTGRSDAGIAQQLPNDPNALAEVRGKQATGEDAGIMAGVAGLGGAAMGIPGVAKEVGRGLLYGGAYQAAKKLGVPPSLLDAVMVFEGARGIPGAITRIKAANAPPPESPNAGGRLVTTKAPGFEQQMTDALAQLRQPEQPNRGTLPPEPTLAPGYTPRGTPPRLSGAKVLNPNISSVEAAAPAAQAQSSIPSLASLKPTIQEINPADMPRDWHAFEDATSRAAGDPVEKAQASRLHQEIMDANQRYRNSTVDERAAFKANPPSVQDLLVALLKGQK